MTDDAKARALAQAKRIERLSAIDGPTVTLEVTNGPGRFNAGGRTISKEALEYLREEMAVWVGTRLQKRLDAKRPATKVRVTVQVEFPP